LTFGAIGTNPMHHLAASCRDLVRIKTCFAIPLKIKLQHCRVLALCQAWLSVPGLAVVRALGTPTVVANSAVYFGFPAVTTRWAEPVPSGMTVRRDLVWSQPILGCVPVHCHSWGHSQQRVMLAQTVVGAIRTLTVRVLPDIDGG